MQTTRTTINAGWRVRELVPGTRDPGKVDWIPAEVPGHIHLDLMRAGVIPDPFFRMSERACAWVDEADWEYETTFEIPDPAPPHAYLRFNGLDTIAEIYLNGNLLAETDNMFIEHEFSVGKDGGRRMTDSDSADSVNRQPSPVNPEHPSLKPGSNTLTIIFRSALRIGRERQQLWLESQGPRPNAQRPSPHWFVWGPRSFVRKAQYMYGWDWGPELVSCGIWKPIELIVVPFARILRFDQFIELLDSKAEGRVTVEVDIEVSQEDGYDIEVRTMQFDEVKGDWVDVDPPHVADSDRIYEGTESVDLGVSIDNCRFWSPYDGSTRPSPYKLSIDLMLGVTPIDWIDVLIGIRSIALETEDDNFAIRVNDERLFVRGANWIPAHSFPISPEKRIGRLLKAASDSGINMLRVWGGGLYESEAFYDLCDELGILVWQDFPYACAYYPDTEEYAKRAEEEARAAVKRLRNHPSLAVWCGNNECHQVWHDHWEGKENPAPRFLGERLYHEILPRVVAEEDPGRPYWPGSPFGGADPNSEDEGDRHNWNVWHGAGDWVHYREDRGRFISEFGFASSCGLNAWDKCLAESDKHPYSPAVRWHDKTRKGYETYLDLVKLHFPDPVTLEDLVYYTQLNQAEALKCGIEHWRRSKGRCWGTLFWQLNDCWPVQSWSVIDSEVEPKAAYFAVKRAYAPVLLSLLRNGDSVDAHLTSDLREHIQGDVIIAVESFDGETLMDETFEAYVDANGAAVIGSIDVSSFKLHARDVYVYARFSPYWDLGVPPVENYLFLAEPKDLRLPDPGLAGEITDSAEGLKLTLKSSRFAPYFWWRFEGVHMPFIAPDNHFHLRAGESRVIPLKDLKVNPDELRARLRIRSL